jgi:hypothetical protein
MINDPTLANNIFMFLVLNQQRYKRELDSLNQQRLSLLQKEHNVFHEEVERQFKENAIRLISNDVTKALAIPAEPVLEMLESMNILAYLEA